MPHTTLPSRQTAADFDPEVMRLFDQYVHGQLDRRGCLDRVGRYAAAASTTAAGLLAALSPRFAAAQKVAPTDPHIEDIARRLAVDNFIAVAPDLLTSAGGYPGDEDKAREAFVKIDQVKAREDFVAAANHARGVAGNNGKLGATGFCYGGGVVNMLATRVPELVCGAPYYGPAPALDQVGKIKAELQIVFVATDERVNALWPPYESALKAAGTQFDAHFYPGTQHGFNNDTTPRFDEAQSKVAWGRTLALFNRTLRA